MINSSRLPLSSRPFFAARLVALLAGLVGAIVVARLLGPGGRGTLSLFAFGLALLAALLGLGLPVGAYDVVARRAIRPRAALQVAVGVAALAGAIAGLIVLALVAVPTGQNPFSEVASSVVILGIAVGVVGTLASQATSFILLAVGASARAAVVQSAQPVLAALAFVVVLVILNGGIEGAIAAAAGASLAAGVIGVAIAWRLTGPPAVVSAADVRILLRRGVKVLGSELANVLSYRIDTVLVAGIAGVAALGRYAVAVQLLEPLWVVASSLAMGILGLASADEVESSVSRAAGPAVRASVLVCVVGGLIGAAGMAVVGPMLLGAGFGTVPVVMLCLTPGIAALAISKVLAAAVITRGGLAIGSLIAGLVVVANVALNVILVPMYEEIGAALASSVSYGLSAILWVVAWRRHGGILSTRDVIPRWADALALARLARRQQPDGKVIE